MIFKEETKMINGYNNKYCITNTGKVFVLDYRGMPCRKEMKQRLIAGYPSVGLRRYINGKSVQTLYKVHRLVAQYFIPNPQNKPVVNHKDGNKTNNRVDNLEWVTVSENTKHAYANKLAKCWWSREVALAAINLIENYDYNFSDIAKLFNLQSRQKVRWFYTRGYKTFSLQVKNVFIPKHSHPKPLSEEYRNYLDTLLKENTMLNEQFKNHSSV